MLRPHNDVFIAMALNLLAAVLYFRMSAGVRPFPQWLPLAITGFFEVILVATHLRKDGAANQRWGFLLLLVQLLFLILALYALISGLPHHPDLRGEDLMFAGARLWFANVLLFTIWYWRFDGGGPHSRAEEECDHLSFLFPQLEMTPDERQQLRQQHWKPGVVDYLFLSFNTSTALSPADTPVIGRPAKLTTMLQATISLSIVVVVIGRSVNIM
ncbi:MAG: hypothetical protein ACAH95_13225 [Fimbriimonas sp.]